MLSLGQLNCSVNQLANLDMISKLRLTSLDCQGMGLTSLMALREMTTLTHLNCSANNLSDLNDLLGLSWLTCIATAIRFRVLNLYAA